MRIDKDSVHSMQSNVASVSAMQPAVHDEEQQQ
jgi:hypothetical protein